MVYILNYSEYNCERKDSSSRLTFAPPQRCSQKTHVISWDTLETAVQLRMVNDNTWMLLWYFFDVTKRLLKCVKTYRRRAKVWKWRVVHLTFAAETRMDLTQVSNSSKGMLTFALLCVLNASRRRWHYDRGPRRAIQFCTTELWSDFLYCKRYLRAPTLVLLKTEFTFATYKDIFSHEPTHTYSRFLMIPICTSR